MTELYRMKPSNKAIFGGLISNEELRTPALALSPRLHSKYSSSSLRCPLPPRPVHTNFNQQSVRGISHDIK